MSLDQVIAALWRRRLLAVLLLLLLVGAVVVGTLSLPKTYSSTATLVVGGAETSSPLVLDTNVSEQLTRTFATLSTTERIADRVALAMPGDLRRRQVLAWVSVAPVERTQLLQVTGEGGDPRAAQLLTNTYADVFVDQVERGFASGDAPARLSVGDYAVLPDDPAKPNPPLYIGLGFVLSLFLVLGVVLLRDGLDTSIRVGQTDTEVYGQPIVARIPKLDRARRSPSPDAVDAFRLLKANLSLSSVERLTVIGVTSGSSSEGKSTVCANFATTAAADGERVVVLEADLRRPGLRGTFLGAAFDRSSAGLTDFLAEGGEPERIVSRSEAYPGLDVVWAGAVPPNPALLLGSDRMAELVTFLRERYDRVILDTSPIVVGADATVALAHVDGCFYVVDRGSDRSVALAGLQQLSKGRTRMLGVILNRMKLPRGADYGYYAADARRPGLLRRFES